jgi:hypothetical protein
MRFYPTRARAFAQALVLSALLAAPARVRADGDGGLAAPICQGHHHLFHVGCCSSGRGTAIPRTYSYYYDTWFNQPRHFRVVGLDGKTYWRTTVRGLPLGTPWPSYGAPLLP